MRGILQQKPSPSEKHPNSSNQSQSRLVFNATFFKSQNCKTYAASVAELETLLNTVAKRCANFPRGSAESPESSFFPSLPEWHSACYVELRLPLGMKKSIRYFSASIGSGGECSCRFAAWPTGSHSKKLALTISDALANEAICSYWAGRRHEDIMKKDIIKSPSGKNVFPDDVEAYYDRTPFISEVCLLGVGDESNPFARAEKLLVIIRPDFDHLKAQHVRINLVMVT